MNSLLIYPLSFLLAILWYKPTQDGEQRVLPFALVTTVDLLALFVILFKKQISHWHDILKQGHLKAGDIESRGNEQVEHRDFGARPETPESEIRFGGPAAGSRGFNQGLESNGRFAGAAMRGPSNRWGNGGQQMEKVQEQRRFFTSVNIGDDSNIHPACRVTYDDTSVSYDGFETPKRALSPTGTNVLKLNQI